MIKLEISVSPQQSKYLEFSQSLNSIIPDLKQRCTTFQISEQDKTFSILLHVESIQELSAVLHSKELGILSGAIRTLGKKSEVVIHGLGHEKRGATINEIRLNYSKKEKNKTIK
jgi:hypothetical protein